MLQYNVSRQLKLLVLFLITLFITGFLTFGRNTEYFSHSAIHKENVRKDVVSSPVITGQIPIEITPTATIQISTATPAQTTPKPTISTPVNTGISNTNFVRYPISKQVSIGTFVPPGLTMVPSSLTTRPIQVVDTILPDLQKLMVAAKSDGIDLKIVSGYRSYQDQAYIFDNYVKQEMNARNVSRSQAEIYANNYSARPGHSEHQLGTTVDVLSNESGYGFAVNENMKFVKWLESNASKYNFKISFYKGNPEYQYEPWHLRWGAN